MFKNKKIIAIDKNVSAISVNNYTKKFKKFLATQNVNFNVGHGVIHGFIGPNGSGKTTVIKSMIGAYIPTKGKIFINGYKSGSVSANKFIGYIPEKASFPKHLNALQYLISMGELSGLKRKESIKKAKDTLKSLKLWSHAKRKPTDFSSGMQKKILLAQSLLTDPKVLILDEPAANLDPTARKELFHQLIKIRNQGKTVFISSHILAELERIVDEVTFIYYGEVIFSGPVKMFNYKKSNVFIKSTDNITLIKLLKENGYKCKGDFKTEVELYDITREQINKLFQFFIKNKIFILSFRANDLQNIYEQFVEKSLAEKRGSQQEFVETKKLKIWKKIKKRGK